MTTATPSRDAEMLRALAERIDPMDSGAFNNLGVLYHSKGMHAEAVDALLHAIALDPRMQTAMRNLEVAAAYTGACDTKLSVLADRVANDPDDRESAREQARLLRLIGRNVEAAQKLDALIAEDPDDAASLLERGLLEQRAGDLRRAQRWFERANNADTANPIAQLQLAEVLYQRGHNEQSLTILNALLETAPEMADAHLLRGFVLGDMGQHAAGLESTRRAAALNPTLATVQPNLSLESAVGSVASPSDSSQGMLRVIATGEMARYGLGLAFRQRGYFAEARQEFVRALTAGEDERLVRHAIAELDLIAGHSHDAAEGYAALLQNFGEQARWHNEFGVALHQRGELNEAAEAYRRALRNEPRYALAYNNLGVALSDSGDRNAAREALERAATIDPTLVRARLNLARWNAENQNATTAISQLRELASFQATNADVWYELALVMLSVNRTDEAHRALATAVEHNPTHAGARYALAGLLHEQGDLDGAVRETQNALQHASLRVHNRLTVGIELQHECPDAAGAIDLLSLSATTPLVGTEVSSDALAALLPERPVGDLFGGATAIVADDTVKAEEASPDDDTNPCAEADSFAARGLHGEALDRYEHVRAGAEWSGPRELWRVAAIGEARSLCLLGRGAEALPLLEQLLQEPSEGTAHDTAELLALVAAAHAAAWVVADGDARQARAAIAQFLRAESRSAALLHFVGDVAMSIREDTLAVVLFRRALAVDPTRPTPRVAIARLLRRRNDVLAARLELVAALAVAPELREALLELAALHCDAKRSHQALPILVSHLYRNPTDVDALALLAHTLVEEGREDDARHALNRARRHDADHPFVLWLEGKLLSTQERVREARERWTHLLSVAPDSEAAGWARDAMSTAMETAS